MVDQNDMGTLDLEEYLDSESDNEGDGWSIGEHECNNGRSTETYYTTVTEMFGRWPDKELSMGLGDVRRNLKEAKAFHKFLGECIEKVEGE